jgi:hypothetical protein
MRIVTGTSGPGNLLSADFVNASEMALLRSRQDFERR